MSDGRISEKSFFIPCFKEEKLDACWLANMVCPETPDRNSNDTASTVHFNFLSSNARLSVESPVQLRGVNIYGDDSTVHRDMDFGFEGGFDKISSFKVNASDLNFSSPPKKSEKPKENSGEELFLQEKKGKQKGLSFFDFNELDEFDLDTSFMKGGMRSEKCTDDQGFSHLTRNDKFHDSRSSSATSANKFGDTDAEKVDALDSMGTSKFKQNRNKGEPDTMTNKHSPSATNLDVPQDAIHSPGKKASLSEQGSGKEYNTSELKENGSDFLGSNAQDPIQELSIQPAPDDGLVERVPDVQKTHCLLNPVDTHSIRGQVDENLKPASSSHSRNSSPVNSCNSICSPSVSVRESGKTDCAFQKQPEQCGHLARGNLGIDRPDENKATEDTSMTNDTREMLLERKKVKENQNSSSKVLISLLHRIDKPMAMKEKGHSSSHPEFLKSSGKTGSLMNPVSTPQKLYAMNRKTERGMPMHRANGDRERVNLEGNQNVGSSSLHSGAASLSASSLLQSKGNKTGDGSGPQDHPAELPGKSISNTRKSIISKLVLSSLVPARNPKITSLAKQRISPQTVESRCETSAMNISRIQSNTDTSKPTIQREPVSVQQSEGTMGSQPVIASRAGQSAETKCTLLSPPLKRKSLEEPNADPITSNPLKRIAQSLPENRILMKAATKTDEKLATETVNVEGVNTNSCSDHPTSLVHGSVDEPMTDLGAPVSLEDDGIAQMADEVAKELDKLQI
ncbi:hypothetical protein QJS04_geneDACA005311 [Acorus gramineus]|uniref:Uncharacterized protein n=1 Tax=Acorus gramineus TaxID=55184 RepID=A0AAV9AVJ2_ACOGR|nr:hypothetical protein QJS04_geneDACA005311 [Acorus gramineus]